MRPVVVKVTRKDQITPPNASLRERGGPGRSEGVVQDDKFTLLPTLLATLNDQAKEAGVPPPGLKRAYASASEGRAAEQRLAAMDGQDWGRLTMFLCCGGPDESKRRRSPARHAVGDGAAGLGSAGATPHLFFALRSHARPSIR